MEYAKVTSKGQITIPAEVRDALGIGVGDSVAFEAQGEYMVVRKAKGVDDSYGCLKEYAKGSPDPVADRAAYARHVGEMDERTKTGGDRSI
jgi:AbrB family looped-hinge helix DNA binding protein